MIQRFISGAFVFAFLLALLAIFSRDALADNIIYQYQDQYGATAFTKNLSDVPVNQRPKAKGSAIDIDKLPPVNVLTSPPEPKSAAPAQSATTAKVGTPSSEIKTQAYWQGRYDKAKADRDAARLHLQIVQYNIRDNTTYGGPGMQQRQAEYTKTEADLQKAITRLNGQINGGIAEEARRAGAPVEWYRNMTGDSASN